MIYLMWIKYLLNGVDFDLKFDLAWPSFILMPDDAGKEYKIIIQKAIFKAIMVDVGLEIVTAHSNSMKKGMKIFFSIEYSEKHNYTTR